MTFTNKSRAANSPSSDTLLAYKLAVIQYIVPETTLENTKTTLLQAPSQPFGLGILRPQKFRCDDTMILSDGTTQTKLSLKRLS